MAKEEEEDVPLMQTPFALRRRPRLKRNSITSHCSKVLAVQPANRLFVILQPNGDAVFLRASFAFFGVCETISRGCQWAMFRKEEIGFAGRRYSDNLLVPTHVAATY